MNINGSTQDLTIKKSCVSKFCWVRTEPPMRQCVSPPSNAATTSRACTAASVAGPVAVGINHPFFIRICGIIPPILDHRMACHSCNMRWTHLNYLQACLNACHTCLKACKMRMRRYRRRGLAGRWLRFQCAGRRGLTWRLHF